MLRPIIRLLNKLSKYSNQKIDMHKLDGFMLKENLISEIKELSKKRLKTF
jgi:hypothetical protein